MRWVTMAIAVLAMSGCGSTPESIVGPGGTIPAAVSAFTEVITVSADSELARMLEPAAPSELVSTVDGLEFPAAPASMWTMPSEPSIDDEVRRLAEVLGVTGEIRSVSAMGSSTTEFGDVELLVIDGAEPSWSLQRSESYLIESGAIPCPTVAFDAPNAGQCANGAVPGAAAPAGDDVVAATIGEVMSTLGVDTYDVDTSVYGDFTDVVVEFSPNGVRSDVQWRMGIAHTGEIATGSGPLRAPVVAGEVTTVGLDEAMLRLSRVVPGLPVPVVAPPNTTIAVAAPDSNNIAVPTAAPATAPPPPVVLPTITSVEPALASVWDTSNRLWLVPAVVVRGDAGFTTTVPIISADSVRVVDPSSVDVPVRTGPPLTLPVPLPTAAPPPPISGPGATGLPTTTAAGTAPSADTVPVRTLPVAPQPAAITDAVVQSYEAELNAVVVGLSIDDASARLTDAGWTVRTVAIDDTTQTVTAEGRVDRVTIQHRNGIIVAVTIG